MGDEKTIEYTWEDATDSWREWLDEYIDNLENPGKQMGTDNINLTAGGEEMLRIAKDGFYVRGVRVEVDEKEAEAVYKAFKSWMTYAILNGEINN